MPANYPPIAPRSPSGQPAASSDREIVAQGLQSETGLDTAGRLAALEASPHAFHDAHHPIRDAVAIALLKPAGELLKRHVQRQRMVNEAMSAPPDSDDPTERPMSLGEGHDMPAILAMAESQVARALLGDSKAFAAVSDRMEGKAGLRKADVDAETEEQRARVRSTIESLVRDMADRRSAAARAPVVDVVDVADGET